MPAPIIVWFRQELRLDDHAALSAAVKSGSPIVPVFIDDPDAPRRIGEASIWWRNQSLRALDEALRKKGSRLIFRSGAAQGVLENLIAETGARGVYWLRNYDPLSVARDTALKAELSQSGLDVQSFSGNLLFEPWDITNKTGLPFKVFTPFWKACLAHGLRHQPAPEPDVIPAPDKWPGGALPEPQQSHLSAHWKPGERGAWERFELFLDALIQGYAAHRDEPARETSRLAPHLRWGEISPARIWHAVTDRCQAGEIPQKDADKFLSEMGWREFSYQLLFQNPDLGTVNLQSKFDDFPWREDPEGFAAWAEARTGYPIIDAGMRELRQTGFIHNRVRMIVASFLIKHLMIDWRQGEALFWDLLVDADPANNTASWQWVAGSGADAAPYFRIFNPITQGLKFDGGGVYTRRFVPEVAGLPDKLLFTPWEAAAEQREQAGIKLGDTYPTPMVDHAAARARALAAFDSLKNNPQSDA